MKAKHINLILFSLVMILSSCELVGDIFKAGMWTGVIAVVLVVVLIIWVLKKIF